MDHAGTFRLESQMNSIFAYGDLADKLRRYEDLEERTKKDRYMI